MPKNNGFDILLLIAYFRQVHVEPKFKSQTFPSLSDGNQDSLFAKWLPKGSFLMLKYCANKMYKDKGRRVLCVLITTPSKG